jgi:hypothetical protein
MAKPTKKELKAVHAVLYKRSRLQTVSEHIHNIDVLMSPLQGKTGERGPAWYNGNGTVDGPQLDAAAECRSLAKILLEIRSELANVKFDKHDRQQLMKALKLQADAWTARAGVYANPNPPDPLHNGVKQIVQSLAAHQRDCLEASLPVLHYLKKNSELHV